MYMSVLQKLKAHQTLSLSLWHVAFPVISTDVGVVKDAFGEMQKEWILPVRSKDTLIDKLRDFYHKRNSVVKCLSSENLQQIKKWDWKVKSENFRTFFDKVLESKKHSEISNKM